MSLSLEDRLRLGVMNDELAEVTCTTSIRECLFSDIAYTYQFLKANPLPQINTDDPSKAIAGLRMYMKSQYKPPTPESNVVERDVYFANRDGLQLRAHVFAPHVAPAEPMPLVVYIHGGGWTIGSPEDTATPCRKLAELLGVTCIAPAYRQGPEDPFPAGINDAWDGLKWIAANAEAELGVSLSSGFVVGGSSAGGNMSAVLAHLARDEGLSPKITGTFLLAPMILPPGTNVALLDRFKDMYLSRTQEACKDDPILSPALEQIFHDSTKGDEQSPMFVPYIWPTGHQGLPRTYFQVCGMDILRDEDLIYEQVLAENGAETKLDLYPGMPHIFWSTFPTLTQGKKAALDFINGIQWLLDGSKQG
jgi:acetyl esterase/lipase